MKDEKATHSARIAAAVALLDRGYGKPTQVVESAMSVEYHISDKPMTPEEWLKQYGTPETA